MDPSTTPPAPAPHPLRIAIIGAGIAGLSLAIGLRSRGLFSPSSLSSEHEPTVTVYERAASFREIGAGIGFTANAERAMRALEPGVHAAFKRVAARNADDWFLWMDGMTGAGDVAAGRTAETPDDPVHRMYLGERGFEGCARAEFLDELVKLLPEGTVRFGRRVEGIESGEGGGARVRFGDGEEVEADVVVGCDGIRSRVRQLLFGEGQPVSYPSYTHKYAFRGLIPMPLAKAALGEIKTLTRHMYLGENGHVLTFPVAAGKLLNVVAFATDDEDWGNPDRLTAPATRAEAVEAFSAFGPTVRAIIDLLPEQMDKWAVFDTYEHPAPTFARGSVSLTGDAAHAAAPYHGAGAGFAIEDAVVLADVLLIASHAAQSPGLQKPQVIAAALQTYSQVRLERALWLVDTSHVVGRIYQWQDENVRDDHEKCAKEIEWRSRKIWDYDIDAMRHETAERFQQQLKTIDTYKDQ